MTDAASCSQVVDPTDSRECLTVVGLLEKLDAQELKLQLLALVCRTGGTSVDLRLLTTSPISRAPVTALLIGRTVRCVVAITFGIELSNEAVDALVAFSFEPPPEQISPDSPRVAKGLQKAVVTIECKEDEWPSTPVKPPRVAAVQALALSPAMSDYSEASSVTTVESEPLSPGKDEKGRPRDLHRWTEQEVSKWLEEVEEGRFKQYSRQFLSKGVNGSRLNTVTASDLFEDYGVMNYKDRKNIIQHIVKLKMKLKTKTPMQQAKTEKKLMRSDQQNDWDHADIGAAMNEMQEEMQRQERANKLKELNVSGHWASAFRRYVLKQLRTEAGQTIITGYIDDPKFNRVQGTIQDDVLDLRIFWKMKTGHEYAGELAYASGVINELGDTIRMNYSHERKGKSNQVDQNQIVLRKVPNLSVSPPASVSSGSANRFAVDDWKTQETTPVRARPPQVQAKLVTARKRPKVISLEETSTSKDVSEEDVDLEKVRPSELVELGQDDFDDELQAMRAEMERQQAVIKSTFQDDSSSDGDPADLRTSVLEVRL